MINLVDYTALAQTLGLVFGPTGAAWLAVKSSLNGTKADIREIKADVKDVQTTVNKHSIDIAVLGERRLHSRHIDRTVAAD